MNNKWIGSFMAVAQEGSVNAAAKNLFISPQALLQQINFLEAEVGVKLFLRQRSGMTLTLAGREFLSGAKQMSDIYERTLSRCRLASQAEDTIRIPVMSSIIWPKLVEEVCAQFRRNTGGLMKTELMSDENLSSWMDGLKNLKYDIIEHFTIDGRCPQGIHFEFLSNVPSWCIMDEYHPLARCKKIKPEDLDGYTLLSPGDQMMLMRYLQIYCDTADIRVEMDSIENDRYQIMDGLNNGKIYMANEDIAKIFVGYAAIPLDFDTHVQHGFACREEMYETYKPFFDIAHAQNKANV